ncbi:MAG: SDR family oxidoreductase [Chloroflexi bacterium]|nr:SDR family oxidoreductase [Chloroflexota bacterium]
MGKLDGKVALVTGAGRGIGRGVAKALASEGCAVIVNDLGVSLSGEGQDASPAQQVVNEISAAGGKAAANYGNVAKYDEAAAMIQQAVDAFGRIDIVVNVAGILRDRMIFNMSEAEWDSVIAVHLKGTFNVCRHASSRFREQKSGRFINFSSSSGFGAPGQPNYAAGKSGILGLTWVLANSMRTSNCTANAILPGAWTRMIDSIPRMAQRVMSETGKMPSETAIGTEHDPDNIAPLIAFLASDAAENISGQCFAASGYQYALISQPQVVKTIRAENGWTVDLLAQVMPKTFGAGLKIPVAKEDGTVEQVGLNMHRGDLPADAYKEIAPGVKYWSIPLPPYGETR